jgi:hypothetical protein
MVTPSGVDRMMPRAAACAVESSRNLSLIKARIAVAASKMPPPSQRVTRISKTLVMSDDELTAPGIAV